MSASKLELITVDEKELLHYLNIMKDTIRVEMEEKHKELCDYDEFLE